MAKTARAVQWQVDHFTELPVLVVACLRLTAREGRIPYLPMPHAAESAFFGSIYPSVQNLLLAARAMGLGASLITLPLWSLASARRTPEVALGVTPSASSPLGWPRGRYGPTTRRPVDEVVHLDTYGNRLWFGRTRWIAEALSAGRPAHNFLRPRRTRRNGWVATTAILGLGVQLAGVEDKQVPQAHVAPLRHLVQHIAGCAVEADLLHQGCGNLGCVVQSRLPVDGLRYEILHAGEVDPERMLHTVPSPDCSGRRERPRLHQDPVERLIDVVAVSARHYRTVDGRDY